jgi:hypothetical protein
MTLLTVVYMDIKKISYLFQGISVSDAGIIDSVVLFLLPLLYIVRKVIEYKRKGGKARKYYNKRPDPRGQEVPLNEQMVSIEKLQQSLESQLETIERLPAALLRRAFSGEL